MFYNSVLQRLLSLYRKNHIRNYCAMKSMSSNILPKSHFAKWKQWPHLLPVPSTNSLTKILYRGSVPCCFCFFFPIPPLSFVTQQTEGAIVAVCFGKWQTMDVIRARHHSEGLQYHIWYLNWAKVGFPSLGFLPFYFQQSISLCCWNNCGMILFIPSTPPSGPIWLEHSPGE